jgi:two-component system, sensor histidine kinase
MDVLHNLRGHLNTIQTCTDLLSDLAVSAGYPQETIERVNADIQRAINAQARFLGDMQIVILLHQQKLILRSAPVDLPALVARVVRQLDADDQLQHCIVTISIDDEIPPVLCDELRIERVLYRIVENALQHTQTKTDTRGVIHIRLATDGKEVSCFVEDDGCGIAPDDLARIAVQLAHASHSDRVDSCELDLSVCARLLALHGGALSITSPGIGLGTIVRIQLPAATPRHLQYRNELYPETRL